MAKLLTINPIKTEKSFILSKDDVYIFDCPKSANKNDIILAVEDQFKVKVKSVKTLNRKGKLIRAVKSRNARPSQTKRSDMKRAYVTLIKGDSIKLFEEEKKAEAKAAKTAAKIKKEKK